MGEKLLIKVTLHPKNKHRGQYNFPELIAAYADLAPFVSVNKHGNQSINFANPDAVMALNKALLIHFYGITNWSVPQGFLCPPIPGRADYIHRVAELIERQETSHTIRCLDIGVGANCIYPMIDAAEYGWNFVGTDIHQTALENAQLIVQNNARLKGKIELRYQSNSKKIFDGIIHSSDKFDLSICNPPFHRSLSEATAGTKRKMKNLGHSKSKGPMLNFGGQQNELWCDGGEVHFIMSMIQESVSFKNNIRWFTTLVSKQEHLMAIYKTLKQASVSDVVTMEMTHGNKSSRIVAWRF